MMTNGDHEGRIFYHILTRIMDYFSCSLLNISFYIELHEKRLPENPECAEMRHGDAILTLQWRHGSTCGRSAAVRCSLFVASPRAGTGM